MLNLLDSVRGQCTDIPDELLSRHFRSLPATYFDRYSAAEIVRHLRMLSKLSASKAVDMEFRPIASHAFEVLAVGFDHTALRVVQPEQQSRQRGFAAASAPEQAQHPAGCEFERDIRED